MVFLMTKDSFLLQGLRQLRGNHEMIKINSLPEIKKVGSKPFKAITDTYHNHILDKEAIKFLEELDAGRIIVLAPYHISKLKAKMPVCFVSRKESIENLLEITHGKHLPHKNSQLCFPHNQFKIMQLILKNKNENNITSTPNVSQQTLKIQKFNITYKLKLRRMNDIVTLDIASYFQQGHKQLKLMAGMTRDADADFNIPDDYWRRDENGSIPLVCVSTSRTLRCPHADRSYQQNGNIFFVVDLTMSITVFTFHPTD